MDRQQLDKFIESWGEMGSVWGLNNSMARVHALLIASDDPLSLDDLAKRLQISRGNASMCLKDLRNWGVVKRVKEPGDRRDYYVTEPDIWKMFFAIARERKRREFDPLLGVLREMLANANDKESKAKARLSQMEDLISTLDQIAQKFLEDEDKGRMILGFLAGTPKKGEGG